MPRPLKTDIAKLKDLHAKGLGVTQIAKQLGVSKGTVSKQLKRLHLAATKNVIVEQAPKLVKKSFDVVDELHHINEVANKLLNELTGEEESIKRMVRAVEAVLKFKAEPTKESEQELKRIVLQINRDKNTAIKTCTEIRGQVSLMWDMLKEWHDMKVVAEYHEELIELLRQTSPKLRDDFLRRIDERQALRRAITVSEPRV